MNRSPAALHALSLAVYAEPLIRGRRVALIGHVGLGVAERLLELGARLVHAYDWDKDRAAQYSAKAPRGILARELPAGEFDVRDGGFDFVLVPDVGRLPKPHELIARLRRVVGDEGAIMVSARNPAVLRPTGEDDLPVEYTELYDLVSLHFACVSMIGAVPFVGVTIAELGESSEAPDVSIDTQLAGDGSSPEYFGALASQLPLELDPYSLIQLPGPADSPNLGPDHEQRAAMAEAQLRAEVLAARLEQERDESRRALQQVEETRVQELEDELAARLTKLEESERRSESFRMRAESLATKLQEAEAKANQLQETLSAQQASATDASSRVRDAEARLARVQEDLDTVARAQTDEIEKMERALRERGEVVLSLEREVARRDALVRELVMRLEEKPSRATEDAAPYQEKLDRMAQEIARYEGELRATEWRIRELEDRSA